MGIIAVIFCICCLIICNKKLKFKLFHPVSFFYCLWSVILFLSILNLYDLKKASNLAYLLIMLMLIGFLIGSLIYCIISDKFKGKKISSKKEKKLANVKGNNKIVMNSFQKKMLYIMYFLSILILLFDFVLVIMYLFNDIPMWQIRNWTLEPFGSSNPIIGRRTFVEEIFRTVFVSPFNLVAPAISAYILFNQHGKKIEKIVFSILSIIILLLECLSSGGGRLSIICFLGFYFLAYLYLSDNIKINSKKFKRFFLIFIVIGFFMVVTLSALRNGFGSFIRECYRYFAMSPTLLSEWIPEIMNIEHTYGLLTFFGLHGYFFRGLSFIGLDFLVPKLYDISYNAILDAEIFIEIGGGIANAFVTPIYYFLIDGGIIFVCIASILFGFLVCWSYKKIIDNKCIRNFIYYVLIMYAVFISFMRIQTCIPSFIITFILVYLIFNNKFYERLKK